MSKVAIAGPQDHIPLPQWLVRGKRLTVFYLDLPMPPSVNNLFKTVIRTNRRGDTVARREKTEDYDGWIKEAGYGAKWPQGYEDWRGIVLLYVDCGEMRAGRDCDNCIKPVQDLAAAMLGIDDARFHWCAAFRSTDHGIAQGRVGVTLILVEG